MAFSPASAYIGTHLSTHTMAHATNSHADEILDKEFKCLNTGFVRLIDYMGGDESIVQAARVSYGRGTKTVNEDRKSVV